MLSTAERTLSAAQINKDQIRLDGRRKHESRKYSVWAEHIPVAAVSAWAARVMDINGKKTEAFAAVRADISERTEGQPVIDASIHAPGPLEDSIGEVALQAYNDGLSAALDVNASLSSQIREKLVVITKKAAWILSVDVSVTSAEAGGLFDTASLAAVAALRHVVLPETKVDVYEGSTKDAMEVDEDLMASTLKAGEKSESAAEFSIVEGDFSHGLQPLKSEVLPVPVTLAYVKKQFAVDPTPAEEAAADCIVFLAFADDNDLSTLQLYGAAQLDVDAIQRAITVGLVEAKRRRHVMA